MDSGEASHDPLDVRNHESHGLRANGAVLVKAQHLFKDGNGQAATDQRDQSVRPTPVPAVRYLGKSHQSRATKQKRRWKKTYCNAAVYKHAGANEAIAVVRRRLGANIQIVEHGGDDKGLGKREKGHRQTGHDRSEQRPTSAPERGYGKAILRVGLFGGGCQHVGSWGGTGRWATVSV